MSVHDRMVGAVLGMAVGDALGAGYEFSTPSPDEPIYMKGGGPFGFEPGEWTDDTAMGIAVLDGCSTCPPDLERIGAGFLDWFGQAKDVGNQTRSVLSAADYPSGMADAAARFQAGKPRAAGNGSLMRTAAVALACPGDTDAIATAARAVSDLTHPHVDCGDACVLWSLAIDHAIHHGEIDVRVGLDHLPEDRRSRWEGLIAEAEAEDPGAFTPNGWVITAFQAVWSSITHTDGEGSDHVRDTLVRAIRIGNDTDTVAAIAGMLLGARWGLDAIPDEWTDAVWGWPGITGAELITRVERVVAAGG